MTKNEVSQLIAILKEYYPRDMESTNMEAKVSAWHLILKDYDSKTIMNAAIAFVSNDKKGFMPTPGQILDKISVFKQTENDMPEMEAWGYVSKALRNCLYHSKEEYEKLPEIIRNCITPDLLREWASLEGDDVQTVIQSHFFRAFRARASRGKEYEKLPATVKEYGRMLAEKYSEESLLENKGE